MTSSKRCFNEMNEENINELNSVNQPLQKKKARTKENNTNESKQLSEITKHRKQRKYDKNVIYPLSIPMQTILNQSQGCWNDIWNWLENYINQNLLRTGTRDVKIDDTIKRLFIKNKKKQTTTTTISSLSRLCWHHLKREVPIISQAAVMDLALQSKPNENYYPILQQMLQLQQLQISELNQSVSPQQISMVNHDNINNNNNTNYSNNHDHNPNNSNYIDNFMLMQPNDLFPSLSDYCSMPAYNCLLSNQSTLFNNDYILNNHFNDNIFSNNNNNNNENVICNSNQTDINELFDTSSISRTNLNFSPF